MAKAGLNQKVHNLIATRMKEVLAVSEAAQRMDLLAEYEELLRYCPMLTTDPETVQGLDFYTLQVLSTAARGNCRQRKELQKKGIAQAKAQGVQFGRPKAAVPKNFKRIVEAWHMGEISRLEAIRQSGLTSATFYRYLKKLREQG